MWGYVRLELTRTLRDGGYVIFAVVMPVVMYLIFTNLGLAPGDRHDAAIYVMVSMAAYGALGGAFNNGSGIAEDRATGWLRQLRLTPLTPVQVVTGKVLTGVVGVVPSIAAVLLAGVLVNHVTLPPQRWLAIIVLLWAGTVPFSLLGLGNGYRLSGQTAAVANVATMLTLSIVGGLWIPAETFPSWLRAIADWTPSNSYAGLSWRVAFGDVPTLRQAAILLAWLLLFAAYAMYGYRRAGRRA
ncbi:ABC transporter permease [Microbispora cellulosiformans]|uniref:ABC transporter permease n=1 Tax=Microbispora cellulosiformans TaxID=2614688 RepID=A0A5J5K2V0_9ACTN|nr:ABC transporter permease [Microbispora cellulosiformans]KAA9378304.1 ABC transporter permease [Microbispora cellulosiformans]